MRLHLVDGTFELFRAHYSARPPHRSPPGKDLKATVGVVQSLFALINDPEEAATHLAVAFDNPIASFRNRLFPAYKSDEGIDPALRAQFDDVEQAVSAAGFVVWRMVDFEADDALATAAIRWAGEVEQVRVLTPDKDLGQVLRGEQVVQVDRIRKRLLTEATLKARWNIGPASVPDFLALVGDAADGIPGLPGWGEKSASAVLSTYPHLEDIPRLASHWTVKPRSADKLAEALEAHRQEALLYRTLATLKLDVPLAESESLDALRWRGVGPGFSAWCDGAGASLSSPPPRPRG
jgi:5'-3' exonuclease